MIEIINSIKLQSTKQMVVKFGTIPQMRECQIEKQKFLVLEHQKLLKQLEIIGIRGENQENLNVMNRYSIGKIMHFLISVNNSEPIKKLG